ncbi:MAG TPA: Holliday junction branch migration protein RuvA [Bacteroidota bacterium]|nr:Holliday junction branch migration protein RuvA [Bacteroidota bacterium]
MIAQLSGILAKKTPTEIVIDVNGVGYGVNISLSTYEKLPDEQKPVTLLTHHHIREESQQLFGFATESERDVFRLLISVSGIGPKTAQTILSGIQPRDFTMMIVEGNAAGLTRLPGIGKKTAERMLLELRDKIGRVDVSSPASQSAAEGTGMRSDAVAAMISLGYSRDRAEQMISAAMGELRDSQPTLELLLKHALKLGAR